MLDELRKKLNAADVIVPPVPRPDFWTVMLSRALKKDWVKAFY